jgi:hypothetical protein
MNQNAYNAWKLGYPAGYAPDARRVDVFDPALKHYRYAFINGPPADTQQTVILQSARASLLQTSLRAIANSSVRNDVLLRGSLTLNAWYGARARRAHDIDLVAMNPKIGADSSEARDLLWELQACVHEALLEADVRVQDDAVTTGSASGPSITTDAIWTYDRAEGRRITLPWVFNASTGPMRDTIQIDVVFAEPIITPPRQELLFGSARATGDRDPQTRSHVLAGDPALHAFLWFASKEESLAWKLLWLEGDAHPQGKDLYDAILLAEDTALSCEVLKCVYQSKGDAWKHGLDTSFVRSFGVEWEHFVAEYPKLANGTKAEALERLAKALRLTP